MAVYRVNQIVEQKPAPKGELTRFGPLLIDEDSLTIFLEPSDDSVELPAATNSSAGVMTASDKAKLDGLTPPVPQNLGQGSHTDSALEITIDGGGSNTTLPAATSVLSGVMTATHAKAVERLQIMYFQFGYSPGDTVESGGVVSDDGYLCIANVTTDTKAAPQPSGSVFWASELGAFELPDTPAWQSTTVDENYIITAQRYTFPQGMYLKRVRIWATEIDTSNYQYEVWSVTNPGQPDEDRQLWTSYFATEVGWNVITGPPILIAAGVVLDIAIIKVSQAQDQAMNALYVYKNDNGNPGEGEIFHQSSGIMRVHKTDKDDVDRTAFLEAMDIGDTITNTSTGTTWSITLVDIRGSHVRYTLEPVLRDPESETTFSFVQKTSYPLPYVWLTDHYVSASEIQGGFTVDNYADIVWNNDAHGIDIELEAITFSTDWTILSFPPSQEVVAASVP